MNAVKASSSKLLNENDFIKNKFTWQSGYGAFSYSKGQRDTVIKYIYEPGRSSQTAFIRTVSKYAS
jgi:putative transposase